MTADRDPGGPQMLGVHVAHHESTAAQPDDGTLCTTGSVRRAAALLNLHHSSVARRLEQIGRTLGFELTQPAGLLRARLALTARRLLDD